MNINHLKYFHDAARLGGVSKASKSNFVTQSAVTRAIQKLEEELEAKLILHKQNHFQLTEVGEVVKNHCNAIFSSIDSLKELAKNYGGDLRGPLRLGCNEAIASKLIAPMLPKIAQKYPLLKPTVVLGNTDSIQKYIDSGEIDFGIVMADGEVDKHFKTKTIYTESFVLVKSPVLKNAEIADHLIVSRAKVGGMSDRYLKEYKKAYHQAITPKMVIGSWQVIMDLAIKKFGYALVPLFLCREEIASKRLEIVKHKVKPLPFSLCTLVAGNRQMPRNADAFLELFEEFT